jgi:hypothetical protein
MLHTEMTIEAPPAAAVPAPRPATPAEVAWMLPGVSSTASDAAARIHAICTAHPDLFTAMLTVVATHPTLSRDKLAVAIQQFRPDCAGLSLADLQGLIVALHNSGRQGFDAVLRTRKGAKRPAASTSWLPSDD